MYCLKNIPHILSVFHHIIFRQRSHTNSGCFKNKNKIKWNVEWPGPNDFEVFVMS